MTDGQFREEAAPEAGEILRILQAVRIIRRYHKVAWRVPGTEAYRVRKFLDRLIGDIRDDTHTEAERDVRNDRN